MGNYRDPGSLKDPTGLNIVVREQGTTTAIELDGEWDLASLPAIHEAVSGVLEDVPACIVLDLTRLEFIDSAGLHAMLELTDRSAAQNTRLVIIPAREPVHRTFELSGLLARLPFVDTRPKGAGVARHPIAQSGSSRSGGDSSGTSGAMSSP